MAQGVVDAFGSAGPAIKFLADSVLPGSKERGIDTVSVSVDKAATVRGGNLSPETLQARLAAISHIPRQNMPRIA